MAGCFDALAGGISLLRTLLASPEEDRGLFERSLDLLAEAQSALRVAVETIGAKPDTEQECVFSWLRNTAAQQQIHPALHADQRPGQPARLGRPDRAIEALDQELQRGRQQRQRQSQLNRLRYHASRIRSASGSDHDWHRVVDTVEEMIADGAPPSNVESASCLAIVDALPEDFECRPLSLVLREIDCFLATCTPRSPRHSPSRLPK